MKICSAKFNIWLQKQDHIFFQKTAFLKMLWDSCLSLSMYMYLSQQKTQFICYFLVILWLFESAHHKRKQQIKTKTTATKKRHMHETIMKNNSAKSTFFWPENRENSFYKNLCQ